MNLHAATSESELERIFDDAKSGNIKAFGPKTYLLRDAQQRTPMHYIAKNGHLKKVPKMYLTKQHLLARDVPDSFTPVDYAAGSGHLKQIPVAILKETISLRAYRLAMENGHGDQLPSKLLSVNDAVLTNDAGWSLLHTAAETGNLNIMPAKALTSENMTRKVSRWGTTPLYLAVTSGHIDQVPQELLTPQNLLVSKNTRFQILDVLLQQGELAVIPKSVLEDPSVFNYLLQNPLIKSDPKMGVQFANISRPAGKAYSLEAYNVAVNIGTYKWPEPKKVQAPTPAAPSGDDNLSSLFC